jgi:hypothetical protein
MREGAKVLAEATVFYASRGRERDIRGGWGRAWAMPGQMQPGHRFGSAASHP